MMTSSLSDEDLESLRRSASDLSDICPCRLAQIDRDFARAYETAREIGLGLRDPLTA